MVHSSVVYTTNYLGGDSWTTRTFYQDASTLCDGHPRATYSPAIALSSTTIKIPGTPTATSVVPMSMGMVFPVESPSCSIRPADCDPLWSAYTTSVSEWNAQETGASATPAITASPMPPPCANSSAVAIQSSAEAVLSDCGPCTIFGTGVQLVYFPVPDTVERDMCASSPSATVTWFDEDVVSIVNGYNNSGPAQALMSGPAAETAIYNGQTYTSGTAYISISSVWIGNRCKPSMGTPVTDAILAMPSESVLSLRYRQDHFQYFFDITTVTGYPFNFADLNSPVPYSAWNGQQMCEYSNSQNCYVIYENEFNPQLAIPPGIRKLRPEWDSCQMWYGGLYDPPKALHPATAAAIATLPMAETKTPASPSSSIIPSTPAPTTHTALAETMSDYTSSTSTLLENSESEGDSSTQKDSNTGEDNTGNSSDDNTVDAAATSTLASSEVVSTTQTLAPIAPFTTIAGIAVGRDPYEVGAVTFGGQTIKPGDPDTIIGGTRLSAATNALVVNGASASYAYVEQSESALLLPHAHATTTQEQKSVTTVTGAVIKIIETTYTVTECPSPSSGIDIGGLTTIYENGPAATVSGVDITAGDHAVVVQGSTVAFSAIAATYGAGAGSAQDSASTQEAVVTIGSSAVTANYVSGATNVEVVGSATLTQGGSAQTLENSEIVSLASNGVVVQGAISTLTSGAVITLGSSGGSSSNNNQDNSNTQNANEDGNSDSATTAAANSVITASYLSGATTIAILGSATLTQGGPAQTLADGQIASYASQGVVIQHSATTVAFSTASSSAASLSSASQNNAVSSGTRSSSNGVGSARASTTHVSGAGEAGSASSATAATQTGNAAPVRFGAMKGYWMTTFFAALVSWVFA